MSTNRALGRRVIIAVVWLSAVFALAACGGGDSADSEAGTVLRDNGTGSGMMGDR